MDAAPWAFQKLNPEFLEQFNETMQMFGNVCFQIAQSEMEKINKEEA